jgi:hypothetical protein
VNVTIVQSQPAAPAVSPPTVTTPPAQKHKRPCSRKHRKHHPKPKPKTCTKRIGTAVVACSYHGAPPTTGDG